MIHLVNKQNGGGRMDRKTLPKVIVAVLTLGLTLVTFSGVVLTGRERLSWPTIVGMLLNRGSVY